jgi:hypothetical protein
MSQIRPGDRVQLLDELTSGVVVSVTRDTLEMRTPDGFVLEVSRSAVVLLPAEPSEILGKGDFGPVPKESDLRPPQKKKTGRRPRYEPPMEVDLHIEKLVPSLKGLSTMDILNYQVDTARGQLEFALRKKIRRVVFIHGVGQGVLKEELRTLFRRYEGLKVSDADPREYGMGATEVYITQAGLF